VNTHTRLAKKQDGGRLHWIREAINTDPVRECFCLPTNAHTTIFNGSITHSLQISKTTKAFFDHLRIQQQQHVSHSVLNRHNTIKQRKHAIIFTFHHGVVAKKAVRHQQHIDVHLHHHLWDVVKIVTHVKVHQLNRSVCLVPNANQQGFF